MVKMEKLDEKKPEICYDKQKEKQHETEKDELKTGEKWNQLKDQKRDNC